MWLVGEGCGVVPSLLVDSDDPEVLAHERFERCVVATYADVLTSALDVRFAGRLLVMDRGAGDPLGRAHIAYLGPGGMSVGEGVQRLRQWRSEGRRWVTAYVNRSHRGVEADALAAVKPLYWVAPGCGWLGPDNYMAAIARLSARTRLGGFTHLSAVLDPELRLFAATPWREAAQIVRWQLGADGVVALHAARDVAGL